MRDARNPLTWANGVELANRYAKLRPGPLIKRAQASDRLVEERPVSDVRTASEAFKLSLRLTIQDRCRLIEVYQAGASAEQVAKDFGLGKGSVVKILNEAGVTRRRGSPSMAMLDEATRLYLKEGWSLKRIGNKFGYPATTIHRHLKRRGVPMRRPWEHLARRSYPS